jgi:cardiolipin synthase
MPDLRKKQHRRGLEIKSRLLLIALFILLQISILTAIPYFFASKAAWVYALFEAISIIIVIHIVSKKGNPSYKITWIAYILIFPLIGGLVYLVWGGGRVFPHVKRQMIKFSRGCSKFIKQDKDVKSRLIYDDLLHARQANFLTKSCDLPVYDGTETKFLAPGERAFSVILEELKKAEKYIFIEFFILAEDSMWSEILEVLRERIKNGVEVRLIFDDFGSITRQYRRFAKRLEAEGIKVQVFNKIKPSANIFMNNRNHRKIIVIDGKVAFTGGMNIADEYINRVALHGYWMDCALMLKGKAVTSFVVMFLSMWGYCTKSYQRFNRYIVNQPVQAKGYVQPYNDGPINDKNPAEGIYMQMINTAQKYVYITTPYLIVDHTMIKELTLAAASGIDVRIITPKIPDKRYVHPVTQHSYGELLESGVKIYEYTPGFIHSKIFVSDDSVATIGTVNMDYRSFYFHFECGVWMCHTETVGDIKKHFMDLVKESEEIKLEDFKNRPLKTKIKQKVLHIFAPFM